MSAEKSPAESIEKDAQDELQKIVVDEPDPNTDSATDFPPQQKDGDPSQRKDSAPAQKKEEGQEKTRVTNNRMEAMQAPPPRPATILGADNSEQSPADESDAETKWTQEHIGTIIAGRYRILELLGIGGMGSVFKAEHIMLGTLVAVKILNRDLETNPKALKRFAQEAKAASSLKHSNIATVSDYGLTESGFPYFVMDLIAGKSLSDLIDAKTSLPWQQAIDFGIQIADAMAYAHSNGIVHRDLKPANIIISPTAKGEERATVVDFGIAKFADETQEALNIQKLTQTGEVFGSPLYMSPEQCTGKTMDGRSDIYSFGCMMYEMVTGEVPFYGANAVQTILKQINEPPPSLRSTGNLQAAGSFPSGLETVILHCLEKVPEERYRSMDDVKADLQLVKRGAPPTCKSVRRFRFKLKAPNLLQTGLVTAIGTITIFLGMAFWINKWQYEMVPWQRDYAQAKRELERGEYGQAIMSAKHGIKVALERKAPKHELAALYIMLGDGYRGAANNADYNEAHKAYQSAIAASTDHDSAKQQVLSNDKLGEIEEQKGQYKDALEKYDKALISFSDRYTEPAEKARLYMHKANTLRAMNDFDGAARQAREAINLYRSMDSVNTPALADALTQLAGILRESGHSADAQNAEDEAYKLKSNY
ncbi:MAG: protein kinase [Cyanobacteria bacterium SZAS LIN-5]|nr:protein kinase [Cyanobacteria bacterium SZAS LIN-5]